MPIALSGTTRFQGVTIPRSVPQKGAPPSPLCRFAFLSSTLIFELNLNALRTKLSDVTAFFYYISCVLAIRLLPAFLSLNQTCEGNRIGP